MPISPLQDLPDTPAGYAQRWTAEFAAAKGNQKEFWERGEKIVDRYLAKYEDKTGARLNLYTSNTQTMESLLFGKTPQVDAERRYADSADDVARIAAEIYERLLNTDLEKDSDTQQEAFKNALGDRLKPGLGIVRCRYEVGETVEVAQEGLPAQETRPNEQVHVDYLYWRDVLWSPSRTFNEMRWMAFANDMPEEAFVKRFGEEKRAVFVPTDAKRDSDKQEQQQYKDPLARCRVWEIWSKERKHVYWFVEGALETVDDKEDPYGLGGFWPMPRPLVANLTTTKFLPTADFIIAQDLYDGIDLLESRITLLEEALRVAGVYDETNDGVKRLLSEKGKNALYPVSNWAMFAEKGGVKGAVDWLPLEAIVGALNVMRECRTEKIGLLYQVTGMSDIMRGQASQQTTATEQAIKARFASVRVQSLQDEFARFCSDTQRIKAEIISKHFSKETIIARSNAKFMPPEDQQLVPQAVDLILSGDFDVRISVNPDSVSLTDFAALKQERMEFAQALATYFQGMMPMIETLGAVGAGQQAVQFTLRMGQSLAAGLKGSSEMEGIFDEFISELEAFAKEKAAQPPQQPPPDPKLQAAQVKAQAEMGKAQAGMQQTQLDGQVHMAKAGMDMKLAQQKHGLEMQKMVMEQQAAQEDHNRSMQSQEGQERVAALKAVDRVTGDGA